MNQDQGAAVEVRSADERDEWEASWYRERLADPLLVAAGVVVVVDRLGYLAVPVGGERRGGYISVSDAAAVMPLRQALDGRDGFPALRVRWSTCPSACHVVEWGEPAPETDDHEALGRVYGYSDAAVREFADQHPPPPSGPAVTERRPSRLGRRASSSRRA